MKYILFFLLLIPSVSALAVSDSVGVLINTRNESVDFVIGGEDLILGPEDSFRIMEETFIIEEIYSDHLVNSIILSENDRTIIPKTSKKRPDLANSLLSGFIVLVLLGVGVYGHMTKTNKTFKNHP